MHVLPNISGSKDNQTMKAGQLIEYNKGSNCFSKNKLQLVFQFSFNISVALNLEYKKSILYKNSFRKFIEVFSVK